MIRRLALLGGLCAGLGVSPLPAAGPFRFDELARVARVGAFSLSPDGRWIACAVATADLEENRMRSAVWMVPSSGGEARKMTLGEKRDSDPKFSPDGKKLAFLSNRDGGSQIWVLDLSGGEPQKKTSFPTEINAYKWSPDGNWFVVTSDVLPDCADVACLGAAADQVFPGRIELFVNVLQTFRSHRLHSHQRTLDVGRVHGIEELGVFRGLHGDLSKEDRV